MREVLAGPTAPEEKTEVLKVQPVATVCLRLIGIFLETGDSPQNEEAVFGWLLTNIDGIDG